MREVARKKLGVCHDNFVGCWKI